MAGSGAGAGRQACIACRSTYGWPFLQTVQPQRCLQAKQRALACSSSRPLLCMPHLPHDLESLSNKLTPLLSAVARAGWGSSGGRVQLRHTGKLGRNMRPSRLRPVHQLPHARHHHLALNVSDIHWLRQVEAHHCLHSLAIMVDLAGAQEQAAALAAGRAGGRRRRRQRRQLRAASPRAARRS